MRFSPSFALAALLSAFVTMMLLSELDGSPRVPSEAERVRSAVAGAQAQGQSPRASAAAVSGVRLRRIGSFSSPVGIEQPRGDSRRFVVEKGGKIMVLRDGKVLARPFLDLSAKVSRGGEQGLLGLAFAPDYRRSRRFYVSFTNRAGDSRVVEYLRSKQSANRADSSSGRTVLSVDQPEDNHNGGDIEFGPDQKLYVALGDGGGGGDQHGSRGNAQNLDTLLGKILRIDVSGPRSGPRYRVPSNNPFVGRAGRDEIFAYGLRNPWRIAFDPPSRRMVIGDVGQSQREEINWLSRSAARGANFGWRVWEGKRRFASGEQAAGHVPPLLDYGRDNGRCSVTAGRVMRDSRMGSLRGKLFYGDFCSGEIWAVGLSQGRAGKPRKLASVNLLSSFGQDQSKRLYALSLSGPVYRLDPR